MMPNQTWTDIVASTWQDHRRWSAAAGTFQARIKRWRVTQLILLIVAVCVSTAAATVPVPAWLQTGLGVTGSLCLAFILFINQHFLAPELIDRWPRARSLSEALKSEIFRFCAGVYPYGNIQAAGEVDEPAPSPLQRLTEQVGSIQALGDDLQVHLPAQLEEGSAPPGALTPEEYIAERVEKQINDYYKPKSQDSLKKSEFYRFMSMAFLFVSTVVSALTAFGILQVLGAWAAVATTLASACAAHAAVNRFEANAISYAKQAVTLEHIIKNWLVTPGREDPKVWSDFVNACEEAISAENKAWTGRMMSNAEIKGIADMARTRIGGPA